MMEAARPILSIGVDIGVSTSGASSCLWLPDQDHNAKPEVKSIVLQGDSSVVPSELGVNDRMDNNWGRTIPDGEKKFVFFKFALLHDDDLPDDPRHPERRTFVDNAIHAIRNSPGRNASKLVTRYIKCLWAEGLPFVLDSLREQGLSIEDMDIRFVFGVPAVWNDAAASRMKTAIRDSGILCIDGRQATLDLIPEPEAAAIAVLPNLAHLSENHVVVICDCGGGTVDLISYEIVQLSPLAVREYVPGEGVLLGGEFLRAAFDSMVETKVANRVGIDNADGLETVVDRANLKMQLDDTWAKVQAMVSNIMAGTWNHRLPIRRIDGGQVPALRLSSADVILAFRSVTDGIVDLTKTHVDAVRQKKGCLPHRVVVVGGFGADDFLQAELRDKLPYGIVQFTELEGQLAVKNGAALAGLQRSLGGIGRSAPSQANQQAGLDREQAANGPGPMQIRSRLAPLSYGFWDGIRSPNEISWIITKGNDIPVGQYLQVVLPVGAFKDRIEGGRPCVPLYCAPGAMPPTSTSEGTPGLAEFCRIKCLDPTVLDRGVQLQLGVKMSGRSKVKFDVFVRGAANPSNAFEAKYT